MKANDRYFWTKKPEASVVLYFTGKSSAFPVKKTLRGGAHAAEMKNVTFR